MDKAPHGISPAMRRVLAEMVERRRRGFGLTYWPHWHWRKGDWVQPASGVAINTIDALIRRGYVRHHPASDWFHFSTYQVTAAGRLALRRANHREEQKRQERDLYEQQIRRAREDAEP